MYTVLLFTGINISLPVSITNSIIFVGLMVLAIVLVEYLFNKWKNEREQNHGEVIYDYPRSPGVVSGENDIVARRVKMTVNPSYGIATCSKLTLS